MNSAEGREQSRLSTVFMRTQTRRRSNKRSQDAKASNRLDELSTQKLSPTGADLEAASGRELKHLDRPKRSQAKSERQLHVARRKILAQEDREQASIGQGPTVGISENVVWQSCADERPLLRCYSTFMNSEARTHAVRVTVLITPAVYQRRP